MASKQAAADAAYRRNEAQHALVTVLLVAERAGPLDGENRQYLDAAIATVRAEYLTVTAPKSKELPGQLALDGSVVGESDVAGGSAGDIPTVCPKCHRTQTLARGWTTVSHSDRGGPGTGTGQVMCGNCGCVLTVPFDAWLRLSGTLHTTFAASDLPPVKVDRGGRKTRGAG